MANAVDFKSTRAIIHTSACYSDIYCWHNMLPYFFSYKTEFSIQNNPKNLDPSYKTDLDLWDGLGRVKLV